MATWNCTGGPCTVDCAGGPCTVDCAGGACTVEVGVFGTFFDWPQKIKIFIFCFHHHDRLGWTIHNSGEKINLLEKNVFRPFWVHFMSILGNFGFLGKKKPVYPDCKQRGLGETKWRWEHPFALGSPTLRQLSLYEPGAIWCGKDSNKRQSGGVYVPQAAE